MPCPTVPPAKATTKCALSSGESSRTSDLASHVVSAHALMAFGQQPGSLSCGLSLHGSSCCLST